MNSWLGAINTLPGAQLANSAWSIARCVCSDSLANIPKKRKLLFGNSCCAEVAYLNRLISSTWSGYSLQSFNRPNMKPYICVSCHRNVLRCKKVHEQFKELSTDILAKIKRVVTGYKTLHSVILLILKLLYSQILSSCFDNYLQADVTA